MPILLKVACAMMGSVARSLMSRPGVEKNSHGNTSRMTRHGLCGTLSLLQVAPHLRPMGFPACIKSDGGPLRFC